MLQDPDEYFMEQNGTSRIRRSLALAVDDPKAWLPEMNPPPFPDCSVVSHSTMAVTSATFNFDMDAAAVAGEGLEDFDSVCDDQRLMAMVNANLSFAFVSSTTSITQAEWFSIVLLLE